MVLWKEYKNGLNRLHTFLTASKSSKLSNNNVYLFKNKLDNQTICYL